MPTKNSAISLILFATFGDLLKYLRRRAYLTQRELAIAVGYSEAHISRLEQNQRLPDLAVLAALFIPALGLEDEPETVARLMELAAAARGERLPATATLSVTHSVTQEISETIETVAAVPPINLPLQLTSFIGREVEMAELERLLTPSAPLDAQGSAVRERARLLMLAGPGGTGKTRLALQVATNTLAAFPDGVWFVELAALTDPTLVAETVAGVLGLRDGQSLAPLVSLVNYARDKTMLLLLDNCEHLIAACAELIETLLRACPMLAVLATSRETLSIAGETVYQVPSLAAPDPRQRPPFAALTQFEAVRLFVERAGAAMPGFALTPDNAPAVVQVCRQLDGIPLALELAAARLKLMRVEEIATRLADGFQLLTGGSRTALPRHQTLRALIDWSYNLLPGPERALLRRLAAFAGGWTLEAAEAVCGGVRGEGREERGEVYQPESPISIVESLAQLVNKSLIVAERKPGAAARFRLLATVRQYALEKLVESGEAEQLQQQHLAFYLQLAEEAAPALRGQGQVEWLERLGSEHDNLRAALSWSLEPGNSEAAIRLAGALFQFWYIRGYVSEGRRWLKAALLAAAHTAELERSSWRARALLGRGVLAYLQGDHPTAQTDLEEALDIYRELDDKFGMGYVLHRMAAIHFWHGDYVAARSHYEESLALLRAAGDRWGIGNSLYGLARLAHRQGDFQVAYDLFEESVTILRQVGDKHSLTRPLEYLAWEVWMQGNPTRARSLLEESLSLYRVLGAKSGRAHTLGWLSLMAALHGDAVGALSLEEQALAVGRETGSKQDMAWSLGRLGEHARRQGDLDLAYAYCEACQPLFQETNESEGIGWLLSLRGHILFHKGDYGKAMSLLEESLALHQRTGNQSLMIYTLLYMGDVARCQGNAAQAIAYYQESLRLHRKRGAVLEVADRLEGLAKVAVMQAQMERAARLMGAAAALRERLGTPLQPIDRDDYERNLAAARAALSEDELAASWAEGQAMTVEQMIDEALA